MPLRPRALRRPHREPVAPPVPDRWVAADDGARLAVWVREPSLPAVRTWRDRLARREAEVTTVVLVHGWTLAAAVWVDVVAALAAAHPRVRIVSYDQRGHGSSSSRGTTVPVPRGARTAAIARVLAAGRGPAARSTHGSPPSSGAPADAPVDGGNDAGTGDTGTRSAGPGSAGPGSAGQGSTGQGSAGQGSAGPDSAGPDSAGPGSGAADGAVGDAAAGAMAGAASIGRLGEDLALVVAAVAPAGPLVLAGHSMGGMAVLSAARSHPELLSARRSAVLLCSTSAGGLTAGTGPVRPLMRVLTALPEQVAVPRLPRALTQRTNYGPDVDPALVAQTSRRLGRLSGRTTGEWFAALMLHDETAALPALAAAGTPVEVVVGDHDRLTPPDHARALADALPLSHLQVVPGAGHMIFVERPDVVVEALGRLLAALSGGRRGRAPLRPGG